MPSNPSEGKAKPMEKVLMAPMTLAGIEGEFLKVLREGGFELIFPPAAHQLSENELIEQLRGVKASVAGSEPYTPRVLDAHPQLKVIARVGVGYDAVDVPAATERGMVVTIAPNTNQDSVAEHTFTLMLALAKNLVPQDRAVREGRWPRKANLPLRGRTLGIVGLGRIGKAVTLRARAFGMKVIASDPVPDMAFAQSQGITLMPFEQLLAEADYVTLHPPATAQTKYLINKQTLALMKPTAFLLNLARGSLVNEADLLDALKGGRLAGAGLDVFEEEPTGMNPLCELENVVVTPHAAGTDLQSRDDMALSAAQAIVSLSRGEWPAEKIVNPEVRDRFRW
jgi:D-3-phosphoglycerate dehydrogenase / 2-oxoglutarate reductase